MKLKISVIINLLFLSINLFATGVSFEENREDAVNDLKTFTVETSVLKLEEGSSTFIPTIKQYWLNSENNSINEVIDFAININDIGTGSNSIYYKWAKDSNNNIILQNGTSDDYNFKINYTNYTNTKQEVKTNNTTISDKFFYNSPTGTILNYATGTKINGIFANNHNSQSSQFYSGGNIINYRYKINKIDAIFINNYETGATWALGGAIFNTENSLGNRSYIDNITGDFVGNYTVSSGNGSNVRSCGGAIFNYTTIENINSNFILNHSNGIDGNVEGGAISNIDIDAKNMAYITNIKGDFLSNYIYAQGNNTKSLGGAILNNGYITNIEGNFIENYIKCEGIANGGAIYNEHYIQNITGNFVENYIDSYLDAYGGAIVNSPSLGGEYCINNIIANFIGNYAKSSNGAAYGGAIYNKHIINNITGNFINNSATGITAYGGAIANEGQMTIVDAKFINNTATSYGGAIYNSKNLNLIADTTNIEFKDNIANGISNAIHDSGRTINLYASENANIIFNDRITSTNNTSILNVNSSTTTLNAVGKIILNEDMSGYLGTVNLYCGEIKLQTKTNSIDNINTNKFFSGNINLSSGTLNILNNATDNITISTLTTTSNVNLKIDVDLSDNKSDNFTVTNSVTGKINLTAINILGVSDTTGQITVFNNGKSPDLKIGLIAVYNGYEYIFSTTTISGILSYKKGDMINLKNFVNRINPEIKSYSLSEDEIVTENLENLGGHQLTIFGNGHNIISSNNFEGIYVANDKILNIENVNNWNGFNNTYGAMKNDGTLNISGTNFSNNEELDIINNGILTFSGISSSFEKGITGTGTTTISGININLANAVIEQNKIEIENNGSLTTKAQNIVGKIENNSNLILIEGTNNNYIFGSGITTINGSVINSSTIANNIKINSSKQLTTSATNINGQIENNGNLFFNAGENKNYILGIGTITIDGSVINSSTIVNNIKINSSKQLTTSATNINGQIENNGNLFFNAGENKNYILGVGTTTIDGSVINSSTIANNIKINSSKQLTTSATNIDGQIENNGSLVLNEGENKNYILGAGTTTIDGSVINSSTIANNIKINSSKQ